MPPPTAKIRSGLNVLTLLIISTNSVKIGISDLNKKYELNEIVKGDSIFCATGITSSEVLQGIKIENNNYTSETLVTHKNSNFKKIIKKTNQINEWFLLQVEIGSKKTQKKIQ